MYLSSSTILSKIYQFSHGKNGRGSKTMFSISDRLANFFGISGAQMEHNTTAKSKQTFFYKLGHFAINDPGLLSFLKKVIITIVPTQVDKNAR